MTSDLTRHHPVSLRRQLAVGIEAAIRDGHLRPGDRLPSTRDLSLRSGLSRGTVNAAYARLRRRGCVVGGSGGRLRVPGLRVSSSGLQVEGETPVPAIEPPDLARAGVEAALADAFRHGLTRDAMLASLCQVIGRVAETERSSSTRVSLFEPRPGLREALAVELERSLGLEVMRCGRPGEASPPVLVRAEVLARGRWRFPEAIPFSLTGGTRERGVVRRSVPRGLVTFVSVSQTVRQYARELAARDFDRGISFVAIDPRDAQPVVRLVAASRLVLFDEASRDRIPPVSVPTIAVRLLPRSRIASLRRYLGLPPAGAELERP